MLQDPFKVNKYLNNLSYLDKINLSFIRDFILNLLINKHNEIDLSSSVEIVDFDYEEKKESVLLIGNASPKNTYNSLIDSFEGDIIRFNRFKTGRDYKLGEKITHWAISKNFATNKNIYENELEESLIKNFDKYKNLDVFVSSYPLLTNFNHPSIKVLNTNECFKIYQKMCQLYIKLNGFVMPYDDSFINMHGAFKPSTGLLVVINSVLHYDNVKIVNFDNFRSNHYWKEESAINLKKYQTANNIIGHHQPLIEQSIINTLFKNNYIDII